MEKEQVHIPSTNSSIRVLTKKQDALSLQYSVQLPNRKRNVISFRVIFVFVALVYLIWFQRNAIVLFSALVILMLYLELSKVCKETVTVIQDTCITYSANTLLGRKLFKSVPINRLLGVVLIENVMGSRVHSILNLIVRTGHKTSEQVPLFTALRPNVETVCKMRQQILSYTEETIQKNVDEFGKDKIMCLEGVHEIDKQKTKQSTKKKER